ncbi:MAG: EAL domain-containing protein [Acidobacteria bacterium]|nr:EAL domain-containing protein [Acidobacteriota bacterium]
MADEPDASHTLRAVLEAMHEGNPRNRVVTERASGAVLLATIEGLIVAVSPKAPPILGRTRPALLGLSLADLVPRDAPGDLALLLALRRKQTLKKTLGLLRGDGTLVQVEVSARRLADGRLQLALGDPVARRRDEAPVREGSSEAPTPLALGDAYHDAVTGLTSRLLVRDRLSTALAQAYRRRARVAVLHLDLDQFSAINATLGRDLGDRLLRSVGRRLARVVREGDTVARLEADAFVMVASGLRDADDALQIGAKVLEAIREPFGLPGQVARVTASLGVSIFPEHGSDAGTLLSAAREALERARAAGGDRLESCALPASAAGLDPLELESAVRTLGSGRLALADAPSLPGELHYQPVLNLATSRIVAVEALLRWQHPRHGLVFPRSFLSHADFTGLILAIEPWIFRTAATQARDWQREKSGLRIAVNVAGPELLRKELPETVKEALAETGLLPRLLELELPEETVVRSLPHSLDVLHRLKALGVALVLDRMAVRHPVLSRLSELPLDGVKLDLTFLRQRAARPEDVSLLGTMAGVARALDLRVAAQGVETRAQLDLLRTLGCVEAQGFHMGHPVPAAGLSAQLARQSSAPAEDPGT